MDSGFRLGFIGSKDIPGTEPGTAYVVRMRTLLHSHPANPNSIPTSTLGPTVIVFHALAPTSTLTRTLTLTPTPDQNNHLRFIVKYHKSDTFSGARIVGFEVEAYSVKHTYEGECRRTPIPSALLLLPPLFPGYHPSGRAPARLSSALLAAPDVATTHSLGPPSETPPFRCRAKWRPLHVSTPTTPSAAQVEPQGPEAHLGAAAAGPAAHARVVSRDHLHL